jgi:hypothetical protein
MSGLEVISGTARTVVYHEEAITFICTYPFQIVMKLYAVNGLIKSNSS